MIITVDTGGTKTLVASFDEEKNPKPIIKFPTPKNIDQYIQRIADQIHLIANNKPIDAISVALPGVVKDGVAVWCQNLGWKNQPIRELLSRYFPNIQYSLQMTPIWQDWQVCSDCPKPPGAVYISP